MTTITRTKTVILIAANLIGTCIVTSFHPYIKHASSPVTEWLYLATLPIAAAAVCYGAYALIAPSRARGGWPTGFLALAWLFAVVNVASPYAERKSRAPTHGTAPIAAPAASPAVAGRSEIDEVLKNAPPYDPSAKPYSEIDEALKNAPAYQPSR